MRHYVLTRAVYGPQWSAEANRRRLDVTRAVTASLMAAQTSRDWTWVVALDPRDPLLEERRAVFGDAAPDYAEVLWESPAVPPADRHASPYRGVQQVAFAAYGAPWNDVIGDRDEPILQTRIDDDDGLAVDSIARYQAASRRIRRRTILMLPWGVRVWNRRYSVVRHARNAMHTLVTPAGDATCVYDYGHATCHKAAPIQTVDHSWGWLWVRHRDTISGWKQAVRPISGDVRRKFPADWRALEAAWE